ncbi:hypothetical protein ES707_19328 [subsurface metagenome]
MKLYYFQEKEGPDEIGTNKEERGSDVPMSKSGQVTD